MTNREEAVAKDPRAAASAWYALAVLIGTALFAFVDRQIINLIMPSLQRTFGMSDLELGALQGLGLAIFASIAGYPIGWLADRFGRRLVLAGCVILWSMSTAACAFQTSFQGFFAATVGIAVGEAALVPIIFAILPDLFPARQRTTANFIFFAAGLLGTAAGLGLGGTTLAWLATHQQSFPGGMATIAPWRVALILLASPGPLFVILLATIRLKSAETEAVVIEQTEVDRIGLAPFIRSHWRAFACIYAAIFAYGLPLYCSFSWLPVAMPRIFGTDPSSVGVPMGMATAIATIVGLIIPASVMRIMQGDTGLASLRMARFFVALGVLPTLLLPFASAPWQIYVLAGCQLALALATGVLVPGLLQQISPAGLRSRLLAVLGIVGGVSQGVSPLLVGAASGLISGSRGILWAIAIVGVPGWLLAAVLFAAARKPFLFTVSSVGEAPTMQSLGTDRRESDLTELAGADR